VLALTDSLIDAVDTDSIRPGTHDKFSCTPAEAPLALVRVW